MKIDYLCIRIITMVLTILVSAGSCNVTDKFPLTIRDIDTLTVFNEHQKELSLLARHDTVNTVIADTAAAQTPIPAEVQKTGELWTICSGVFKEKKNARRMFSKLNRENKAYVLLRDSLMLVTTGLFPDRDSALDFRRMNHLSETVVLKLRENESWLDSFPE